MSEPRQNIPLLNTEKKLGKAKKYLHHLFSFKLTLKQFILRKRFFVWHYLSIREQKCV